MTIKIEHDSEHGDLVRISFEQAWTWEEWYDALGETLAAPYPGGLLIDLAGGAQPTNSGWAVSRDCYTLDITPAGRGLPAALVSHDLGGETALRLYWRLNRRGYRLYLADSLEAAQQLTACQPGAA